MEKIIEPAKCCGCSACYNVCPKEAITMKPDNKGFLFPEIDNHKCIDCGLCKESCPVINTKQLSENITAFACFNKNEKEHLAGSSGSVFVLLAKWIIKNGGVVFGAQFDKNFNVCHSYIENENNIYRFMGSKYVQSAIGDTYKKAKYFLQQGRFVLFSGTPCQTQGLMAYLKKDYEKLYIQDIICHGVPSPESWRRYLKYQIDEHNEGIKEVCFRNKDRGWSSSQIKVLFDDKQYCNLPAKDPFLLSFSKSICLRDTCYNCSFKSNNRVSDITLADFWGIEKVYPEIKNDNGVSLVLINSKKGRELFEIIKENTEYKQTDFSLSIKYNPAFAESAVHSKNEKEFADNLCSMRFDRLVRKYVPKTPFFLKIIYKAIDIIRG